MEDLDKTRKIPTLSESPDEDFTLVTVEKEVLHAGNCVETNKGVRYNLLADLKKKDTTWTFLGERAQDRTRIVIDFFFLDEITQKVNRAELEKNARAFISLQHPNIVSGLDYDLGPDYIYYVTKYVESVPLLKHLKREGSPDSLEVAETMLELAGALDYLGNKGLLHGNITPASLVVPTEGSVKLSSFQLVDPGSGDLIGEDPPYHLAPEQLQNKEPDHRTDIYAMGASFFFMLTGRPPFKFTPIKERLKNVPDPVSIRPTINPYLGGVVMKMMAPKPKHRYQSGKELAGDLQHVIEMINQG